MGHRKSSPHAAAKELKEQKRLEKKQRKMAEKGGILKSVVAMTLTSAAYAVPTVP